MISATNEDPLYVHKPQIISNMVPSSWSIQGEVIMIIQFSYMLVCLDFLRKSNANVDNKDTFC